VDSFHEHSYPNNLVCVIASQFAGYADGFFVGRLEGFGDGLRVGVFKLGQPLGLLTLNLQIRASTHFA
jgi:hypothetical protein